MQSEVFNNIVLTVWENLENSYHYLRWKRSALNDVEKQILIFHNLLVERFTVFKFSFFGNSKVKEFK